MEKENHLTMALDRVMRHGKLYLDENFATDSLRHLIDQLATELYHNENFHKEVLDIIRHKCFGWQDAIDKV